MSTTLLDAEKLEAAVRDLTRVRSSTLGLDVQLPILYPDGETVVVSVAPQADGIVVHDGGNGAATIMAHGSAISPKLQLKLESFASHYGCNFIDGRMTRWSSREDLPVAITIVANASRTIADQILYTPNAPKLDFRVEVLEVLRETVGIDRVREGETVLGESGSKYTTSAVILSPDKARVLSIVEPIKDHDAATKKFREFWDISQNTDLTGLGRISLYDDRKPWSASDLNLLQNVSNIVRLTDGSKRMRELAA